MKNKVTWAQELKGFVVRANQKECATKHNTDHLDYLYLSSFVNYNPKKCPETFEYNWTAYGHEAHVFLDRVDALKMAKKLQAEEAGYKSKTKYQVLTFRFANKQEVQ